MDVIFKSTFSILNSNPLNYVLLQLHKEISQDQGEISRRIKTFLDDLKENRYRGLCLLMVL